MSQVSGSCGHLKASCDNHPRCFACSRCSFQSRCQICKLWPTLIWMLLIDILTFRRRLRWTRRRWARREPLLETQFLKLLRVAMTFVNLAPGLYPGSPTLRTLLSLSPRTGHLGTGHGPVIMAPVTGSGISTPITGPVISTPVTGQAISALISGLDISFPTLSSALFSRSPFFL